MFDHFRLKKLKNLLSLIFFFFLSTTNASIPTVIVSVAPHQFFVNKIAEKTVNIYLMVPSGASSHTYEPTARQMMLASQASIWFSIGEPFEKRAMQALNSHSKSLQIVNLQQGLDLITHQECHKKCCPGSVDLHFWLSPRQAQIQAITIANSLIKAFPEHANFYQENLIKFQKELQDLDSQIIAILNPLKNRRVLVGHPAYAYFCRDYQLEQYSIEIEGKDPTPQQITKLLTLIHSFNLKKIFIQSQYNNKAADLIAKQIGGELVQLDPYSEEYLSTMLKIATAFANQ